MIIFFFLLPLPFIILSALVPYLSLAINILLGLGLYQWRGRIEAMGFVGGVCLFSWVVGYLMHYSFRHFQVILIGIILGTLGTGLFFSTLGGNYLSEVKKAFDQTVLDAVSYYREEGLEEEKVSLLQEIMGRFSRIFSIGFPAILLTSVTAMVSFNYFLARHLLVRLGHKSHPILPLSQWRIPDTFIWIFIAAFFLIWVGRNFSLEHVYGVGLNFMILILMAYLVQGLSLVNFFLKKWRWPFILRIVLYFLLILQPVFWVGIILWGIFEVWFNFRKIEAKEA